VEIHCATRDSCVTLLRRQDESSLSSCGTMSCRTPSSSWSAPRPYLPPLLSVTLAAHRANIIRVPRGASQTWYHQHVLCTHEGTRAREGALVREIQVCPWPLASGRSLFKYSKLFPRALCARRVLLPYRRAGKRDHYNLSMRSPRYFATSRRIFALATFTERHSQDIPTLCKK